MRFLRLVSTFWLFSCYHLLIGADPYYIHFTTENGLPSNEVYEVAFDPDGVAWFCTDRGVSSYNGYEFRSYSTHDGLTSNTILEIGKDPQGRLWFTGLNGSFSYLTEDGIRPFEGNELFWEKEGRDRMLNKIFWDDVGNVYFAPRLYQQHYCRMITADGTQTRLLKFEDLMTFAPGGCAYNTPYVKLGGTYILETKYAQQLVSRDGNVFLYNPSQKTLYHYRLDDNEYIQALPVEVVIHDLYEDLDGNIWACTGVGAYRFQGQDILKEPDLFFENTAISKITQDRDGNYWVSTLERGAFLVPSFDFVHLDLQGTKNTVLALQNGENYLVGTTLEGKIFSIDTNYRERIEYESHDYFGDFSYLSRKKNRIWAGDFGLKETSNGFEFQRPDFNFTLPISLELRNGDLLHCGHSGVHQYYSKGEDLHFRTVLPPPAKVRILCGIQKDNMVFLGTNQGILKVTNYDYYHPELWMPDEPLLQCRVNDLIEGEDGWLWVATIGNGLLRIKDDKVIPVTPEMGLQSNMINRVVQGKPGVVWAGTNRGLYRIDYETNPTMKIRKVQGFSSKDGLPTNFIRDISWWRDQLWVATDNGIVHFDPRNFETKTLVPPHVVLEDIQVNHASIPPSASEPFAPNQNDLLIRYVGISSRRPPGLPFYRYRLLGADTAWTYTDDRSVQFYDLPAGDYSFEVGARSSDGAWTPYQANFDFSIRPHFSETWWFRILVVIGVLGIGMGIVLGRLRRIKATEEQRRRLQKARYQAREAELLALRSQMNPHFVFNALNSIQNYIFQKNIPRANYYLSRFARLMRDGLQFSKREYISLEEELEFLRNYLELEKMRFPERFEFEILMDEGLPVQTIGVPPFLFQPLLENSVKHAFKDIDYPGKLTLEFRQEEDSLRVRIEDNGPGFDPDATSKTAKPYHESLGLKIVRDRIALLQAPPSTETASFRLDNLSAMGGRGMRAEFYLPILKPTSND